MTAAPRCHGCGRPAPAAPACPCGYRLCADCGDAHALAVHPAATPAVPGEGGSLTLSWAPGLRVEVRRQGRYVRAYALCPACGAPVLLCRIPRAQSVALALAARRSTPPRCVALGCGALLWPTTAADRRRP